jgi:Lipoprotein LpqB beta-propeller domain
MSASSTRPRRTILVVLAVAVLVLTGCVRVPTSGPVQFATATPNSSQQLPVLVFPAGPPPDATPEEVAKGFLDAMASYQPGYAVARQFLTPRAAESWDTRVVDVYDTSADSTLKVTGSSVLMSSRLVGSVGSTGIWTPAQLGAAFTTSFPMVRVDGQWRIDQAPAHVLISSFDFQREYLDLRLFFFDATSTKLIADPRYLPVRGIEGALLSRLAGGPSAWLAPVVRTAFPGGARTVPPTVQIIGDLAQVKMSDERVSTLNESQKRYLIAQVASTLAQLGVQRVQILVGASAAPLTSSSLPPDGIVDANLFAGDLRPSSSDVDALYAFVGGRLKPIRPPDATEASRRLARISGRTCSVSQSGDRLAMVSATGTTVYLADESSTTTLSSAAGDAGDFAGPSFDPMGNLWLVDRATPSQPVRVILPDGKYATVRAPGLVGRDIRTLRVGPDGIRAAVVVEDRGGSRLLLARIERSGADSEVLALADLKTLPLALDRVSAVGWQDADQLVVLAANGDAPLQPFQLRVDGSQVEGIASAPPAVTMTVMPDHPLVIGRSGGTLSAYDPAQGWLDLGRGTAPCYPS